MSRGDWRAFRSFGRGIRRLLESKKARAKERKRNAENHTRAPNAEDRERREHQNHVELIEAINGIRNELQATENQESAYERKKSARERLVIIGVFFTAFLTLAQGVIFFFTLQHARIADKKARRITQHTLDEMQAEQRPWVTMTVPQPVGQMTWDKNGPHLRIAFHLGNVGHRPAIDVRFYGIFGAAMFDQPPNTEIPLYRFDDWRAAMKDSSPVQIPKGYENQHTFEDVGKALCDEAAIIEAQNEQLTNLFGHARHTLPKGYEFHSAGNVVFPNDDWQDTETVGRPKEFIYPALDTNDSYQGLLGACVRYRTSPTSPPHHTLLVFIVGGFDGKNPDDLLTFGTSPVDAARIDFRPVGRYAD